MAKLQKKITIPFLMLLLTVLVLLSQSRSEASDSSRTLGSLTYLVSLDSELSELSGGDPNRTAFFNELEKRTRIHINWSASLKSLQSLYQFRQSSNSAPDLIDRGQLNALYGKSLEQCLADGVIMDLTKLVQTYAPNYYRLIQKPEYKELAYTPSGQIAAIYSLKQTQQNAYAGLQLRGDWLDELGLSVPETYDDWETVLTAFREQKGATAPLCLPALGYSFGDDLNAGYHVSSGFFHINGEVYFGPAEEGWRSYLKRMNRWYKKGLIDPNFMTGSTVFADPGLIGVGAAGAWYGLYTMPSAIPFDEHNRDAKVTAALPPKQHKNDSLHLPSFTEYTDNYIAITSECENPGLALQWIDYLFSEEGALFANYGVEGISYTTDENGMPQFTELVLNNPDGLCFTQALKHYTFPPGFACAFVDWKREQQALSRDEIAMCDVWSAHDTDYVLPPNLPFTLQERERLAEISERLYPLVQQYAVRFICGDAPFSEYGDYLRKLSECGVKEAVEIYRRGLKAIQRQGTVP